MVTALRTAFPDLRFEVHDVLGEGNLVATRSTMTGTHRAPLELGRLAQLPATGRRVAVPHTHFFRWEGRRVAEFWHVWDTMLLLRQLGAPAPDLRIGAPVQPDRRSLLLAVAAIGLPFATVFLVGDDGSRQTTRGP